MYTSSCLTTKYLLLSSKVKEMNVRLSVAPKIEVGEIGGGLKDQRKDG